MKPLTPYPEILKKLLIREHIYSEYFREYIRNFNSVQAFASMGEKNTHKHVINGRGPYCYYIQGQTYHCTSALYPNAKNQEQFAQLYILEPKLALTKRLQNNVNKSK